MLRAFGVVLLPHTVSTIPTILALRSFTLLFSCTGRDHTTTTAELMDGIDHDSPYALICESDFGVIGLQPAEVIVTPIRIICTLVTVSVTSAWFHPGKVRKLDLFFGLWVSGLLFELCTMAEFTMISVCWTQGKIGR
ncbi:unnamed protein product, partial [Ectocarpus sp. 8 AP-2014]